MSGIIIAMSARNWIVLKLLDIVLLLEDVYDRLIYWLKR